MKITGQRRRFRGPYAHFLKFYAFFEFSFSSAFPSRPVPCVQEKRTILWFRKGLRLHDNPALHAALDGAKHLYPIFIADPWFYKPDVIGPNRIHFLLETLTDLQTKLEARSSRLLVLRGKPEELLPQLIEEWGATDLVYEFDTEPYAKERDARVRQLAEARGVRVASPVGHTLYDPADLHKLCKGGKLPLTMQGFTKMVDSLGDPPAPLADPPAAMPGPEPGKKFTSKEEGRVPTLTELGYEEIPADRQSPFRGGETAALARLEDYLKDKDWVCKFEKPNTDPSAFLRPATTVLSPHLKFGSLSPRLFHSRLLAIYREAKGKHAHPPVSLRGQLLWREYFYFMGHYTPNFGRMEGNPICKQIPWVENEAHLRAWEEGRTGYPWIDAIMNQLRTEGWMHHLARHSVACFLTRGDLYISWEKGRDVFDKYLLDADWSLNSANWMWLSASAFFFQFMRVYSPVAFGKKYDPTGKFVRKYVPVLAKFPDKYIYEPWKAPIVDQKAAGCVIGVDYPKPIVNHDRVHKENIGRHAAAYKAAREGGAAEGEEDGEEEKKGAKRAGGTSGGAGASGKKAKKA